MTEGTGSTGVPTDRSTAPPGKALAFSAIGASSSQGYSGSRDGEGHSAAACGGSAATVG